MVVVWKSRHSRARFTSTDALWEQYRGWSPYHYAAANPVMAVDVNGFDGYLTIHANGEGLLGGHAWISYAPTGGQMTTYGTWGNNPDGKGYGLLVNIEKHKGMVTAEANRTLYINDSQEQTLFETISEYKAMGYDGWKLLAPCSAFAQDAWMAGTGEYLDANTWLIVNNPETLKNSIINANGGMNNNTDTKNKANQNSSSNSIDQSSASSGQYSNSSVQPSFIYVPETPEQHEKEER